MAGRTVRQFLEHHGYAVHTPAAVFGRKRLEKTLLDTDWLPVVGARGWVVFCRDQHILERPAELQAYLKAKIHMFMMPGSITRAEIVDLLTVNLADICTLAAARKPNVYWLSLTRKVVVYERRLAELDRKRKS